MIRGGRGRVGILELSVLLLLGLGGLYGVRQAWLRHRLPERRLEVRVVFGYKDARPARFVADRYEQMLFVQGITRPCTEPGRADCGFTREGERWIKTIYGGARKLRVRLQVLASSAGADDAENRRDPYQAWRSRYAQRAFLEGLREADIVFYDGHSRAGGGPDFFPPRLTAREQVDYRWYRNREPGLREMEATMRSSEASPLRTLGLFSCASEHHFAERLRSAQPGVRVVSSTELIYFADALQAMRDALSAALVAQAG